MPSLGIASTHWRRVPQGANYLTASARLQLSQRYISHLSRGTLEMVVTLVFRSVANLSAQQEHLMSRSMSGFA